MSDRFMLNLGASLDAEVERLADEAGITKAEVVRHALRFYLPLETAQAQGANVLVVHADGRTETFRPQSIHGSRKPGRTPGTDPPQTLPEATAPLPE